MINKVNRASDGSIHIVFEDATEVLIKNNKVIVYDEDGEMVEVYNG